METGVDNTLWLGAVLKSYVDLITSESDLKPQATVSNNS